MPTRLQSTIRSALLNALGTAFKELVPGETVKTAEQPVRLANFNSLPAVACPFVGQVQGGVVLAGREMQFRRFGMMALSHRLSIAEVAALDEAESEQMTEKTLQRVALRVGAHFSARLAEVTKIRPGRPSLIPANAKWPTSDFDLFTGCLIEIGTLQLVAYAGVSARKPSFKFPPSDIPSDLQESSPEAIQAVAQPQVTSEIKMDVGSPPPEGFEAPEFGARFDSTRTTTASFDPDLEDVGDDGVLIREAADFDEDEMWD